MKVFQSHSSAGSPISTSGLFCRGVGIERLLIMVGIILIVPPRTRALMTLQPPHNQGRPDRRITTGSLQQLQQQVLVGPTSVAHCSWHALAAGGGPPGGSAADGRKSHGDQGTTTTVIEYDDFLPQPNTDMTATEVVEACMRTLLDRKDGAGLEVCFHFSSDRCRAALGGSLEKFKQYATNPVFGYLLNCEAYKILSVGSEIAGTPTRGAMQTVLMAAQSRPSASGTQEGDEDDSRRFLWTMQRERRPPLQGCWIIHEVMYVRNAFMQTL